MADRAVTSGQPAAANGESAPERSDGWLQPLEQRVRRLEEAVAALQDTHSLEERIVNRVSERLARTEEGREPPCAGARSGDHALAGADAARPGTPPFAVLRGSWLLDGYAELRTMVRMFQDRRYRLTWPARIVPATALVLILTSWIWLPGTIIFWTGLMTVVDKVIDLALAYVAFKVLNREVRRYRELTADLPSL